MNYEIVNLTEKLVAGYAARTNNTAPDMSAVISGLWKKFYSADGYPVKSKAFGIYTDYAGDEKGDYTVMAACEVSSHDVPDGFTIRNIPAVPYARFVIKGNMITAVTEFWERLWQMNLNRAFTCDFEEYQNGDPENCEIHIYIALKEE